MNPNMQPFSRMPLGAMGMGLGGQANAPPSEVLTHPRPPLAAGGNAKKKRRTNAKNPRSQALPCPITQWCSETEKKSATSRDDEYDLWSILKLKDLNMDTEHTIKYRNFTDMHIPPVENQPIYARPPQLSGYGDTVIASNPFDDMPSRAAQQIATMHSGPMHMHPHQQQQMGIPRMRGMNPMSSMSEMGPMMGHMGTMNQPGNPINPIGRISPTNMSGNQPSMSAMNPMSRMSPMNNMGQPSPINMMSNPMGHENPMNMGPNQPPGHAMNNRASPMNMGSNQPTGPMNMMGPMGRMSPMKNSGPNQSHGSVNAINMGNGQGNCQGNGPQMGSTMGRPILSPINISGNQNHMENGPMNMSGMPNNMANHSVNGPFSMGNPNGPYGPNAAHPFSSHMGMQMNAGNMGRDPMNTMNSVGHGNMNTSGPNGINNANMGGPPVGNMANEMNVAQRMQMGQQMGGSMGNMPGNMYGPMGVRHPMNMGGNMPPHGFPVRSPMGTRPAVPPSNGKVYPPDQHIIFNSQNRNAPPIYLCGSCHKEVNDNDQGIVCESGCNIWFHRSCVGLSEAAFHMLTQAPYAEWVCDNCTKAKKIPPIKFTT